MAITDPSTVTLRPMHPGDLPLLHAWFAADHVRPWFGERTMEDVISEYTAYFEGRERVWPFMICLEGTPIGIVSWSRFGDFADMMESYEVTDKDAANCDILIGDLSMTGRGVGPVVLEKLLTEHVFADRAITSCIIDPHGENARAIRAYERVGFRFLRRVHDHEDGRELHLMVLSRP